MLCPSNKSLLKKNVYRARCGICKADNYCGVLRQIGKNKKKRIALLPSFRILRLNVYSFFKKNRTTINVLKTFPKMY